MNTEIPVILSIAFGVIGGFWAIGKILASQYDKRLDEKFKTQKEMLDLSIGGIKAELQKNAAKEEEALKGIRHLEAEFAKQELSTSNLQKTLDDQAKKTDAQLAEQAKKNEATQQNVVLLERILNEVKLNLVQNYVRTEDFANVRTEIIGRVDAVGKKLDDYMKEWRNARQH